MSCFAVIGLGSFGTSLACTLSRLGGRVVAIDHEMVRVESMKDEVHTALRMDARDRETLEERGIHRVDCAIVCMGEDFEAAEICAIHLTELGCGRVLVRATSRERAEILGTLVPGVIQPGVEAARELAVQLLAPGVTAYASLAGGPDVAVAEVSSGLAGATVSSVAFDPSLGVHLLARLRGAPGRERVLADPAPEEVLEEGDRLYLLGTEESLLEAARHLAGLRV